MRITILPKTLTGKWSFGLAIASILIIMVWQIGLAYERHLNAPDTFPHPHPARIPIINWFLVGFTAVIPCMASFISGLIGIIKSKERSILIFLITLIGLLVLLYEMVIIFFAHSI